MPVPMHMVTIPYFCLRLRSPCTIVAVQRGDCALAKERDADDADVVRPASPRSI